MKTIAHKILLNFKCLSLLTGSTLASLTHAEGTSKPNIILIVSDDQGYADVGFQGLPESADIPTPHLDKLAASGVRFTNGYATGVMCAPSRAGLLTGRSGSRFGFEHNLMDEPADYGPPTSEIMLPQFLKPAGYISGIIGKWHLGKTPEMRPEGRGFDEFFGFLGGLHWFHYASGDDRFGGALEDNGETFEFRNDYLTNVLSEKAVDFIDRHAQGPFFLYMAYNAPHTPLQAPSSYLQRVARHQPKLLPAYEALKSKYNGSIPMEFRADGTKEEMTQEEQDERRLVFSAMIAAMDDGVGEIMSALKKNNILNSTIVFFLSDNGAISRINGTTFGGRNGPLRSGKGETYEGGIRVPFVMSWPGKLPEGTVEHRAVWTPDIFGTVAAVAGLPMPDDREMDGVNLIPYLTGENKEDPHAEMFWRVKIRNQHTIRSGNKKLIRTQVSRNRFELYDLENNVSETKALNAPEQQQHLRQLYENWRQAMPEPMGMDEE
ncbi:sulfatase-like hydrolase/transferase [Coraliomargarita sp. W4R53]